MVNITCPDCKSGLEDRQDILYCCSCGASWNKEDGVPVLAGSSAWYPKEHMTREQFGQFLEEIDTYGWAAALERAMARMEKPKAFYELAFNEVRRDLSHFLPVTKESVVLDYGCGVGGISFNMAKSCGHVYSIDQSIFRTKFINARSRNTGVRNITPICTGNTKYLPFPDSSFDIVIMNGVLEWMPLSLQGHPAEIQVNALKEINRVLKKRGVLYLAIENRFGYRYVLFGKGDSHNQKKRKMRFITVIPKFFANIYSYILTGGPYRCYLYSYKGYKKMLYKSGFISGDFYFPYPDHNTLNYIIPINNSAGASSFLRQILNTVSLPVKERIALSFLQGTGLLKYLAQDYSIIAAK